MKISKMQIEKSICSGNLVKLLGCTVQLIFLVSLVQGTSAVSENPLQHNWDVCTYQYEEWGERLCNPGESKNHPSSGCSPRKRCCACPLGTFMDKPNNCSRCKPWRDCHAEGREISVEGSPTVDAICGDVRTPPTTVESIVITSFPPTGVAPSTKPNQSTEDESSASSTTAASPPGDDANEGTSVIKLDRGSVLAIVLCTLLVLAIVVIIIFVGYPVIPDKLNRWLSHRCCRTNKRSGTNNYERTQGTDQVDSNGTAVCSENTV